MEHIKNWITKEKIIICLIILLATILSSFFVFNNELIKGVDTEYHLSRIKGIVESWKAGDFAKGPFPDFAEAFLGVGKINHS